MASDIVVPGLIHPHGGTIQARIYHGHWIADCGNPHCDNAMRLEYGSGYLCAGDDDACGWAFDVEWPDERDARAICALLLHRPARKNRNWFPYESVVDIAFENMAHGISHATTPEVGAAASQLVLDVSGDGPPRVVLLDDPVTIEAARPLEIEG